MANRKARRAVRFGRELPPPKHSRLEGVGHLMRQLRREELDLEDGELAGPATSVAVSTSSQAPEQVNAPPTAVAPPLHVPLPPPVNPSADDALPAQLVQVLRTFAPDFAALVIALHKTASRNAAAPAPLARPLTQHEVAFVKGLRAFLASRRLPTSFLDAHTPS